MDHKYCIHTKTGRVAATTPALAAVRDVMVLPNDSEVAQLFEAGVHAFDVIPAPGEALGFVFSPIIPHAWDDEKKEKLKKFASGESIALETEADLTKIDPIFAGVRQLDNDGNVVEQAVVSMRPGGKYTVPDDFDVDVDISTMDKAQLTFIAKEIEGFPMSPGMQVAQLRKALGETLEHIRKLGSGAETAPQGGYTPQPAQTPAEELEAKDEARAEQQGPIANELPPEPPEPTPPAPPVVTEPVVEQPVQPSPVAAEPAIEQPVPAPVVAPPAPPVAPPAVDTPPLVAPAE